MFQHILIATGGWPQVPDIPGKELAITSNEAFYLKDLPRRVLVVGGGYIAVEFAGIFQGLGSATTLLYRGDLFLRGFDGSVRTHLKEELEKRGLDLQFNADIQRINDRSRGLRNLRADAVAGNETDRVAHGKNSFEQGRRWGWTATAGRGRSHDGA